MDGLTRCLKMFVFHTTKPKFSLDINKNALNMNIEKNSLKCAAFSNEEKKRRSSNEINIDNWYTVTGFEKLIKMKNGDFWELRNYFYGLEIFHLDHTAFCIVYLILNWTAIMLYIFIWPKREGEGKKFQYQKMNSFENRFYFIFGRIIVLNCLATSQLYQRQVHTRI